MASYKKISNGNWKYIISYTDDNGNYRQKTKQGFPTKTAAKEVAEPLEIKLKANASMADADMLFTDYYSKWAHTYKYGVYSPATDDQYKTAERIVNKYFKGLKVKQITKDRYQKFIKDYSKGKSKETVRKNHNKIGACLRHAFHTGVIPINITHKINITGNPSKPKEEKFLNQHELRKLIIALQDGLSFQHVSRYMLLLQASTGARIGEIMALTFDSFDFEKETLTINKGWDYKYTNDFADTKNGVHRIIDLDKDTIRLIRPFYDHKRKQSFTGLLKNSKKLVFVDDYMELNSVNAINKSMARACKRAGLERFTSHALRHTHASMLILNGVDIQIVAERLGDTVEVIASVYSHVLKETRDKNKPAVIAVASSVFG